jgi:hypothetical protein
MEKKLTKIRILASLGVLACIAAGIDTFVNDGPRLAGVIIAVGGSWLILSRANRAMKRHESAQGRQQSGIYDQEKER